MPTLSGKGAPDSSGPHIEHSQKVYRSPEDRPYSVGASCLARVIFPYLSDLLFWMAEDYGFLSGLLWVISGAKGSDTAPDRGQRKAWLTN